MQTNTHWFEQPADESIRLCLRLDSLFKTLRLHMQDQSAQGALSIMTTLAHVLNAVDRSDLSSKLQALAASQIKRLEALQHAPKIDSEKLEELLKNIHLDSQLLKVRRHKPGEKLRQNVFFSSLKQQLCSPNGLAEFNSPQYSLWIRQSAAYRSKRLGQWLEDFETVERVASRIVQLTRSNGANQTIQMTRGFYEQATDPAKPYHLVRICIDQAKPVYPMVSIGNHKLEMQLRQLDLESGCSEKYYEDLEISVQLCRL